MEHYLNFSQYSEDVLTSGKSKTDLERGGEGDSHSFRNTCTCTDTCSTLVMASWAANYINSNSEVSSPGEARNTLHVRK